MVADNLQARILHRIDTEVSPNCMHRLPSAECLKPNDLPCPIVSNLDRIIEIVRSESADRIEPYVARLREQVCRHCGMEDENGRCELRDRVDCCLDAFFVLVVQVIEEELSRRTSDSGGRSQPSTPEPLSDNRP